jgi:hypothetical protein
MKLCAKGPPYGLHLYVKMCRYCQVVCKEAALVCTCNTKDLYCYITCTTNVAYRVRMYAQARYDVLSLARVTVIHIITQDESPLQLAYREEDIHIAKIKCQENIQTQK